MKVVVADQFSQEGIQRLSALGWEVVYDAQLNDASLVEALQGVTALIVRSTKVTQQMMESPQAASLEIVVRAGAGVDNIHIPTATSKGIFVCNCPGKNSIAVAELAFGHMLAADRKLVHAIAEAKGQPLGGAALSGKGLTGRTFGIIGLGAIGKECAKRAKVFGMKVVAMDIFLTPEAAQSLDVGYCATPEEVAAVSDFITVHVALTPQTRGMFNAQFFAQMKPDAVLINTSRGEVVNEEELKAHLDANPQFMYVTDVPNGEPAQKACDWAWHLAGHPQIYATHHIGASTQQAEDEIGKEAVRVLEAFQTSRRPPDFNLVNKMAPAPCNAKLILRYKSTPGALSAICQAIQAQQAQILNLANNTFGPDISIAFIDVQATGDVQALVSVLDSSEDVVKATATQA